MYEQLKYRSQKYNCRILGIPYVNSMFICLLYHRPDLQILLSHHSAYNYLRMYYIIFFSFFYCLCLCIFVFVFVFARLQAVTIVFNLGESFVRHLNSDLQVRKAVQKKVFLELFH